jgi:hypothetical protein
MGMGGSGFRGDGDLRFIIRTGDGLIDGGVVAGTELTLPELEVNGDGNKVGVGLGGELGEVTDLGMITRFDAGNGEVGSELERGRKAELEKLIDKRLMEAGKVMLRIENF